MRLHETGVTDGYGYTPLTAMRHYTHMLETAPVDALPTNTAKYKRLSDLDKAFALRYAANGMTQVEIAKRLGVTQGPISEWLSKCQDSTAEAGQYLRGRALPMAEKVVKRGRPSDLLKALQGVGVIAADQAGGMTIIVGSESQVQINVGVSPSLSSIDGRNTTQDK